MNLLIGENIKNLRKAKDITQEQLSVAMNVTCAAVSKWERGETFPDITLLQPLAFYFGVSVDELLGYNEEKIKRQIGEQMDEYYRLCRNGDINAIEFIANLYTEYPNDYRVMNAYMWSLVGDMADNDTNAILKNEDELNTICDQLLLSCTDENLRHQAWNMRGKILHAKGRTDEALKTYREHMNNWYQTAEQKSEQLFQKDTPEFLHQVKLNTYELASFCADKFHKSVFFDKSIPYEKRIARIEVFADSVTALRKETGEFFWAVMERSVKWRLFNDLIHRGGEITDILRVGESMFSCYDDIKAIAVKENIYEQEKINKLYNINHYISYILSSQNPHIVALRKNDDFVRMIDRYNK